MVLLTSVALHSSKSGRREARAAVSQRPPFADPCVRVPCVQPLWCAHPGGPCDSRADIWRISADCLVHSTNEALKPRSAAAMKCFQIGGPRLIAEVQAAERCRTGEAIVTSAGNLPAKYGIVSYDCRSDVMVRRGVKHVGCCGGTAGS